MTGSIWLRWLEADRDGELRGWRRRWLHRAVGRSPRLRAERAALDAIGDAVRAAETEGEGPSLWADLERSLQRDDRRDRLPAAAEPVPGRAGRAWARPHLWRPAAAAFAAALVLAVLSWWSAPGPPPHVTGTAAVGHVAGGRVLSLDTGGRTVWVQEGDGATIIWLVGSGADGV